VKLTLLLLSLSTLCIQGCSVYKPKSAVPSGYLKAISDDLSRPDTIQKYNAMPESSDDEIKAKIARRNQLLNEMIYLVDQNYSKFESHFYGGQAAFSTVADAANLGLTGASSVTGTAELKSILSATATATTGFKTSVEKNFFDQQSRAAIVAKMRSLRAAQLATLNDENHMKAGLTVKNAGDKTYSLEAGISDVGAYYDAGTVVGALQSISQSAGTEASGAADKQQKNSAKPQAIN